MSVADAGSEIYVEGRPLSTIAGWGDLEYVDGRNGPWEATWSMALKPNDWPAELHRNAQVEITCGPNLVSAGTLGEPDRDSMQFTMIGISRAGEGAECLNGSGQVTSKLNTAIDQAIVRGPTRRWVRGGDFGNTDLAGPEGGPGVDDPNPGKLNELLKQRTIESGLQWRVHPEGLLVPYAEDESTPDWLVLPGAATMGVADDDVTDVVFLRYFSSTAGQLRTAQYPASTPEGGIERRASITHLGPMNSTRATAIAEGMWRRMLEGRTGWTNGIELTVGQIITPGGQLADFSLIRGGQAVRLMDTPDPRGVGQDLDVVIDEVRRAPASQTIQLNPVGLVARTFEQVAEEANAREAS